MSEVVLDASALLALLRGERGARSVAERMTGAAISSVNLCEVAGRLMDAGLPEDECRVALGGLDIDVVPFDTEAAYGTAALRTSTRRAGLSLGDRACLALAIVMDRPALTADRAWKSLRVGARVEILRRPRKS